MKIKTSELTGAALDYAVASIENPQWFENGYMENPAIALHMDDGEVYSPSTDWNQGGPIIEREHISLNQHHDGWWIASIQYNYTDEAQHTQLALSPLIAAMRCFVMSKLGDEVEIPEELA